MSDAAPQTPSFEQALTELEQLVHELEDGQVSLEESLARYERGIGLLKQCYGQLQEAEQRILQLTGVDENGKPIVRAFEHTATAARPAATNSAAAPEPVQSVARPPAAKAAAAAGPPANGLSDSSPDQAKADGKKPRKPETSDQLSLF